MRRLILAGVAASVMLVGCGSSDEPIEERPATSPMEASEEPREAPVEDPFAPNLGERALTVGEQRDGRSIDTGLREIRYPYPPAQYRDPQPGNVFVGLRVSQCMTEETEELSYATNSSEWSVVTPNGSEFTGGSSWNDWPQPKFPENVTLTTDRCLKGWITLEVPEGTKIASVIWRSLGESLAEWLPPAKRGDGANT